MGVRMVILWVFMSMIASCLSQSGDGEWGSAEPYQALVQDRSEEPKDAPTGGRLRYEPDPDRCSSNFHTCPTSARPARGQREELSYLQAIQHGNQAVIENLVQYVSAEMGEHSYQEVIQENIFGIKDDHLNCEEVVKKVIEDLESQLEGDELKSLVGTQKIKEESLAFESMLRSTTNLATKLESSTQTLYASLTKHLKKSLMVEQ